MTIRLNTEIPAACRLLDFARGIGAEYQGHSGSAVVRDTTWMLKVHSPNRDRPPEGVLDLRLKSGWKSKILKGDTLDRALKATSRDQLLTVFKETE